MEVDPHTPTSVVSQDAEYVAMAEDVASAQRVYLFHEFNTVIGRLNKKYGVREVAEQCRVWAEFIEAQVARIDGGGDDA